MRGGKCSFEHHTAKEGRGKGTRSGGSVERDNFVERQYTRKTGRSASGKEDRLPRVNCSRKEIAATIEGVIMGILRIANTSRKINAKWERIVHSFTRKRRSDLPLLHERKQGKQNVPIKGKVSVAIVNLANHCSTCTSLKHPRATQDKP